MQASVLEVRTREKDPHLWASTRSQMAMPAMNLGSRTPGEAGRTLIDQAIGVLREVSEVRTFEDVPDLWAVTQSNLTSALDLLGDRTPGLEGARFYEAEALLCREILSRGVSYLDGFSRQAMYQQLAGAYAKRALRGGDVRAWQEAAAEARRQALRNADRELDPADWAAQACELGATLLKLARWTTTDLEERAKILEEAEEVLREGTAEAGFGGLDRAAPLAHLAEVRWLQGRALEAVLLLRDTVNEYRDYREGHLLLRTWAHDHLFDFELAYRTMASWVQAHPGDFGARAALTLDLLTTGRFGECLRNAAALREDPRVSTEDRAFVLVHEIAARRILQHSPKEIAALLRRLAASVVQLPPGLTAAWKRQGTRYFLEHAEEAQPHRAWLLELFAIFRHEDRGRVGEELERLAASVDLPRA
jgi:hypothetical protein